jgi:transcriptional antiterminator RfaH
VYWACAQTEPRREAAAQHFLELAGYRTYLPRLRLVRPGRGRKIETRPPLFPAYVFVWIVEGWWSARWCPHIVRLIAAGDGPVHVSAAVVDEIKARERDGLVELPKREAFRVGDAVRVSHGPFAGCVGLYAGMRPHERVLILLALLGGQRPVELARGAVEAM